MAATPDYYDLWDYADPAATETRFRALPDQDDPELQSQVARTLGLQGRFDEGRAVLDEVQPLAEGRALAACLIERGRLLRSGGDPAASTPLFDEAFKVAVAAGADDIAVDAAHMLAIVGDASEQVQWALRGVRMAEGSPNVRARMLLGALHNNLGWTYHDRGEYESALAQFARGQAVREQFGQGPQARIARWTVARALRSLNRNEEALNILRALEAEHASEGAEDPFVIEEIAENLHASGQTEYARPYFARAAEALAKIEWVEPERVARLRDLANGPG
ncbi:MAG: tetratricopeptide repeat protein [Fimbriimonadaceae bacterium]|nr:tetratricopeptide repeat protein [Fimbriimonadaceae bacterium]